MLLVLGPAGLLVVILAPVLEYGLLLQVAVGFNRPAVVGGRTLADVWLVVARAVPGRHPRHEEGERQQEAGGK